MKIHIVKLSVFLYLALTVFAAVPGTPAILKIADIQAPAGYKRIAYDPACFSTWLRELGLKKEPVIRKYDGTVLDSSLYNFYNVFAVPDMPMLFKTNLEQCADYCMRFRAEYFKACGKLDALFLFNYNGSKYSYKNSRKTLLQFLKQAMSSSNSHSLKKGCTIVDKADLRPGDMIVQNDTGGIGHVSMIMDACENGDGEKRYLIGFSFMPAQEFHIEKAVSEYGKEGWFTIDSYLEFLAAYYNYGTPVLRRFPE